MQSCALDHCAGEGAVILPGSESRARPQGQPGNLGSAGVSNSSSYERGCGASFEAR